MDIGRKQARCAQSGEPVGLVEGMSIRATVRMTGVSKPTILKLLRDLRTACALKAPGRSLKAGGSRRRARFIEEQGLTHRAYPVVFPVR